MKKYSFEVKQMIIELTPVCFWFWGSFNSFLDNCCVPRTIQEKYPQGSFSKPAKMRNIISDLESRKYFDIIDQIISEFYKLKGAVDRDNLDVEKAKSMLAEFRELIGNDPIDQEIEKRSKSKRIEKQESDIKAINARQDRLNGLRKKLIDLGNYVENPQFRGFELERLVFELLAFEEFEFRKSYRSPSEQIDGLLKYEKFDYLLEIKWEATPMKQKDFSIFDGKIKGKAQSTRGLFFAMNGFDLDVVAKLSGSEPRIILMDGQDFMAILEGRFTFSDCMKYKVDALVSHGNMYSKL
jgi:hypothetical protein